MSSVVLALVLCGPRVIFKLQLRFAFQTALQSRDNSEFSLSSKCDLLRKSKFEHQLAGGYFLLVDLPVYFMNED